MSQNNQPNDIASGTSTPCAGSAGFPPCPAFVRMEGALAICVGAGRCAERKVRTLLSYGAQVVAIAPEATAGMRGLAQQGAITWLPRSYQQGDLGNGYCGTDANGLPVRMVLCATSDSQLNAQVAKDAHRLGLLANVVDDPQSCDVELPSTLRRGDFQVAVSTGGTAPGLAREVRRGLESSFPEWFGDYVRLVGQVRALVQERIPGDTSRRMPIYQRLYALDLQDDFQRGCPPTPEELYRCIVGK